MFHGNAGAVQHRLPLARVLVDSLNCNVLMMEYRGYGLSTGTPDEKGIMIDAQTGLDFILKEPETQNTEVVVYGQSLGGAVTMQLVANNQHGGRIKGMILENTFTSMRKLIPRYAQPERSRLWKVERSRCLS